MIRPPPASNRAKVSVELPRCDAAHYPHDWSGSVMDMVENTMQTVTEWSAGGIVLKRSATAQIDVLLLQHSMHKGWSFPKGGVEPGETPQQAAVREVQEESGVLAEIIADLPPTRYFF